MLDPLTVVIPNDICIWDPLCITVKFDMIATLGSCEIVFDTSVFKALSKLSVIDSSIDCRACVPYSSANRYVPSAVIRRSHTACHTLSADTINAALNIQLEAGYDPAATSTAVQTAISNYIYNLGIGGGVLGYVYASQLIAVAVAIQGVVNATTTFTDTQVLPQYLPQAGTITIGVI